MVGHLTVDQAPRKGHGKFDPCPTHIAEDMSAILIGGFGLRRLVAQDIG